MFPIEEDAAVTEFEATIDGKKTVIEVNEKELARSDYEGAIKDRKTAVLLEETQPDIFRMKIGQLKPGTEANISIKCICEFPVEDNKIKLTIPTTVAPRYIPSNDASESSSTIASISYSKETPAPLSISIKGMMTSKIKSLKSPSHEFNFQKNILDPKLAGRNIFSDELC
jgi:hypothetical protein